MGIISILLKGNSAEGTREAMKLCYKKASGHKFITEIQQEKHKYGMMMALKSRYMTFGKNVSEELLAIELSPFILIKSQEIAIDALCEYIVYKEKTIDAKIEGLKNVLNRTIKESRNEPWYNVVAACTQYGDKIPWMQLLEDNVINDLKETSKQS